MREPQYVVMLDSKPTNCRDEPDGPWAADVVTRTDGADEYEHSERWLVCDQYVTVTPDEDTPFNGPMYAFTCVGSKSIPDIIHYVQDCDVDRIVSVEELRNEVLR